MRPNIDNRR